MAISESAQGLKRAVLTGASQQTSPYRVKTALNDDHLMFRSMRMTEALSTTFEMQIDMLSSDPAIDFDAVLGHNLTVGLLRPRGEERYLNGYVSSFGFAGMRNRLFLYRATVSPWLWLLKQTSNCMIFHEETALSIAEKIFAAHGFADYRNDTKVTPPTYEYCVQYRESDFDFVSRLFEKEGIYYYFEHENGKHTMVIADDMGVHSPDTGYETIPMVADDTVTAHHREGILTWRNRQQIRATHVTLQDYNFTKPRAEMNVDETISRNHAASGLQLYQYPGEYKDTSEGKKYAKLRVEEQQSAFDQVEGDSNVHGIRTGYRFELERHAVERINTDYLVTSTTIECESGDYNSGEEAEMSFSCSFTAMPLTGRFRPPSVTPKPKIYGPQTAVVSNKTSGEEIEPVDKHGRVTVLFGWEREGKLSCPVRVSQMIAGAGWGSMNIPRHGQEVIVEFEEGNPDRPLITGRVYNGKSEPPYNPLEKPTVTTIKTNSSKGGGGFNELRFDDEKGEENVFIHAEKTMDTRVKNTRRTYIGWDDHQIVENDQFLEVKETKHETIGGESRLTVKENISINGDDSIYSTSFKDTVLHAATGDIDIKAKTKNVVIEAKMGLTLKCGSNFITLNAGGVAISGMPFVNINSGGSALSGPGEQVEAPDPPLVAKTEEAGEISEDPRARSYMPTQTQLDSHPVSYSLIAAAQSGKVVCKICEQMARGGS